MDLGLRFRSTRRAGLAFAVALVAGISAATAAETVTDDQSAPADARSQMAAPSKLKLTPAQKQAIVRDLATEAPEPAAAPVHATVGSKLPTSIALRPLPTAVATDVPSAKDFSYAKLHNNDIVIVDPKDRVVADVIPSRATTGSGDPGQ